MSPKARNSWLRGRWVFRKKLVAQIDQIDQIDHYTLHAVRDYVLYNAVSDHVFPKQPNA